MKAARVALAFGCVLVLAACATQPKPPPQEDPRIGQLQGRVDALQKQVADLQKEAGDKDATIKQLQAKADDLQSQVADLTAQKKADDDQIAAANERIGKIQAELDGAQQDDAAKIAELNTLGAKLAVLQKASDRLLTDIDALRSGSSNTQADYLAEIDSLNKGKAALQDRIDDLTRQDAALQIAAQENEKDLEARVAQLKSLFANEIARGDLDIRRFRDVLIVSVKDSALFPPDSPKLRPETMNLLKRLSEVFKSAPDRIVRIEGNTAVAASSPESLRLYPTSWHLGAARAANVAQYLQEKCGMDPRQLVATSMGEFRPRADNSTEAGKAQNRRVDFVLIARSVYDIDQLKTVVQ
jgi:chemotaxis protein MotB